MYNVALAVGTVVERGRMVPCVIDQRGYLAVCMKLYT